LHKSSIRMAVITQFRCLKPAELNETDLSEAELNKADLSWAKLNQDTRTKAAEFDQDLHLRHDPEWRCPQIRAAIGGSRFLGRTASAMVFISHL
jgi:uncharacterized protein YjbI with pentapeptide repeats